MQMCEQNDNMPVPFSSHRNFQIISSRAALRIDPIPLPTPCEARLKYQAHRAILPFQPVRVLLVAISHNFRIKPKQLAKYFMCKH